MEWLSFLGWGFALLFLTLCISSVNGLTPNPETGEKSAVDFHGIGFFRKRAIYQGYDNVLPSPLKNEELKQKIRKDNQLVVTIKVPLESIIGLHQYDFNDFISKKILPTDASFNDLNCRVVGHSATDNSIVLEITGEVYFFDIV